MENLFTHNPNIRNEIASAKKNDNETTPEIRYTDQPFFAEEDKFKPCPEWEEKLAATHPDDLTVEERIALEEHLKTCPSCAAVRKLDRILDIVIHDLPTHDTPLSETSLELPPKLRALLELPNYLETLANQTEEPESDVNTHVDRQPEENNIDHAPIAKHHFTQSTRKAISSLLNTLKRSISYTCKQVVKWYTH